MSYPKEPCEICGDPVSTHPGARAIHMKRHADNDKPAETSTIEPKSESIDASLPDINEVKSAKERQILEKAIAAQKQYAVAPTGFVSENTSDPYHEKVKTYAPESLDVRGPRGEMIKRAEWHPFWADAREVEMYATRAYRPVISDGEFVRGPGNEVLMLCPRSLYDAHEKNKSDEHAAIVASEDLETGEKSTVDRKGTVSSAGVNVESETLTVDQF